MPRTSNASAAIATRAAQQASVLGLHAISIGGLAKGVGMTKGGVCAHFPKKRDLQLAAVREAEAVFRKAVLGPTLDAPAGLPQLQHMCAAWFAYVANQVFEGGCFFTNTLLLADGADDTAVKHAVAGAYNRYLQWIERTAAAATGLGQISRKTNPRTLAFDVHGIQMATLLWRALGRIDALAIGRGRMQQLIAAATATD
jgi:AcrR family transcriptional regulator